MALRRIAGVAVGACLLYSELRNSFSNPASIKGFLFGLYFQKTARCPNPAHTLRSKTYPVPVLGKDYFSRLSYFLLLFYSPQMDLNEQIYNAFNSDGKLLQLEYGLEAVYSSYQIVSVVSNSEVIFVSKKVPQPSLKAESHTSIFKIADNLYLNITGLPADIDYVVDKCRDLAASKEYLLGCPLSPDIFARYLADKFQSMIQRSGKRAPAFSATVAGFELGRPMMHYTDISAIEYPCFAAAAGEDHCKITKYLEKHYTKTDRRATIEVSIAALLQSIGKDAEFSEIEVGVVTVDGVEYLSDLQIDEVLRDIAENS